MDAVRGDAESQPSDHVAPDDLIAWLQITSALRSALWAAAEERRHSLRGRAQGNADAIISSVPRTRLRKALWASETHPGHIGDGEGVVTLPETIEVGSDVVVEADRRALEYRLRELVDRMEAHGYLHLASMLVWMARQLAAGDVILESRFSAVQARSALLRGDEETFQNLYERIALLGQEHDLAELRTRAHLGRAVLAQLRGNYPDAARLFEHVRAEAMVNGHAELQYRALHGLFTIAARHGSADALLIARQALPLVKGVTEWEVELLGNIAQFLTSQGRAEDALHAYAAIVDRHVTPRIMLPVLGGAALAAAALGRNEAVASISARATSLLRGEGYPFQRANAHLDLALADIGVGALEDAQQRTASARAIAERFRFHAVEFRVDEVERNLAAARDGSRSADTIERRTSFSGPIEAVCATVRKLGDPGTVFSLA